MKMDDLRIRKTKNRKSKMIEWIQAKNTKKTKNKKNTKKDAFSKKSTLPSMRCFI